MPREVFEHITDIGLRIRAKDLQGLFEETAASFYDLATDYQVFLKNSVDEPQSVEMNFQEENAEELFIHWLQELLFFFSARKLVLVHADFITVTPLMLKLRGKAIRFDPEKHVQRREIKAITYHASRVVQTRTGWEAEVIFDI